MLRNEIIDNYSDITIVIDRTNGGKGRINSIKIYNNNILQSNTAILLQGKEIQHTLIKPYLSNH